MLNLFRIFSRKKPMPQRGYYLTQHNLNTHNRKQRIKGNGHVKTIEVHIDDFDSITLSSSVNLDFIKSDNTSIKITADSNILDVILLECADGTLDIGIKADSSFTTNSPLLVTITHPILKRIDVTSSGYASVCCLRQHAIQAHVSGSGDLDLRGSVREATLKASGNGDIRAKKLTAVRVDAYATSQGDIVANATEYAIAKVAGMADIVIHGKPPHKKTKGSGMGTIKFR